MKLAEMKAFAAMTDEQRASAIRREELRQQAIREYDEEWFQPDRYGSERPVCGCGESYWSLDEEGQKALNICFDSDGKIGSDMWESVQMCNLYCIHCGNKPKVPQRYIDEYITVRMEVAE
jgi:hypothetical protein